MGWEGGRVRRETRDGSFVRQDLLLHKPGVSALREKCLSMVCDFPTPDIRTPNQDNFLSCTNQDTLSVLMVFRLEESPM